MKHHIGKNYVEEKDKPYIIKPNENFISGERKKNKIIEKSKSSNDRKKLEKNQKLIQTANDDLEVKGYPKERRLFLEKTKIIKFLVVLFVNRSIGLISIEYILVVIVNLLEKHQISKEVFKWDRNISSTLPYANIKDQRNIFFSLANREFESTKDIINKWQLFKEKTKLGYYQKIG